MLWGYKVITLPVCLSVHRSVHISYKRNHSLTDEPVLVKLYTVAVYNLWICMKEDILSLNLFKGVYVVWNEGFHLVMLTHILLIVSDESLKLTVLYSCLLQFSFDTSIEHVWHSLLLPFHMILWCTTLQWRDYIIHSFGLSPDPSTYLTLSCL